MVMGPPSPQVAPADWLGHVLDQGPKPLPYAPEAKYAIRQHLVDLVTVRDDALPLCAGLWKPALEGACPY